MKATFTSEANALEGKPRAVSSLVKAQGRLTETERGVKQIHAEFAKSEDLLGDFDRLQGDRAKAEAEVHRRKETLDKLEAAQKELDDKRGQFEQWQLRATGIQKTVTQLEADANKYSQYEDEIRQANAALKAKQATLEPLEAAIEQATKARQDGAEQRRKLDEDQPKHGLRAKVVRTMRLLFDIRRRAEELSAKLTSCRELVESTEEAERQLGQTPTPSSKDISCIQSAIQRIGEVDAELNAAQLVISIDAKMPLAVTSIVDGSPEEKSNVTTEEPRAWQVRQHANIVLSDVATFNVRRGAENVELEKLVAERKVLDAGLQVQLQQWDIPTTDRQSIVPSLTTLTTARAELQARATGLRDQLKRVAPKGVGSLETESAFLSSERNRLLKDCPEVMDWDPTESAVIEAENQLQAEESSLQSRVRDVSALERDAAAGFASAQQQLQIVQTKLSELKTALAADQARLGELTQTYGSQEKLGATLTLSRDELASAQAELEKHRLTEEQERVASDLADAKAALDESQKRHADIRERIAEIQGELRNVEGLHARRVALEQALGVAQRDLDRTTVDLEARRLLLQLFAQARDESVEKAIAPVSELVGTWLTRLYGPDHLRVNFTTDLKVKDVTVPEGNSLSVSEATSYGEREQLGILVRLAYGAALAQDEKQVVIIDDPLAHSDDELHERMLAILGEAADKNLQILVLTCHADRFRKLAGAVTVDLPGSPEV